MTTSFIYFYGILIWALSTIYSQLEDVTEKNKLTIVFGSCSHQDKQQKLWDEILTENPDIWIWLGDNIYGDSDNMEILRTKYNKQKQNPDYQQLLSKCRVEGVWDDHDYGLNDGGKNFTAKSESKQELLRFLDVSANDPRRTHEGIYYSFELEQKNKKIKFLLLDTRYFRDDPLETDTGYLPNFTGTILGNQQWKWLEKELKNSKAEAHIVVSSIQVISDQHKEEKWGNFPNERKKLLDLLSETKVKNPIILSGDRHIGEISKINWKGKTITEITSSSLTHASKQRFNEKNPFRKDSLIYHENYGIIEISLDKDMNIQSSLKGDNNKTWAQVNIN